MIQEEEVRDADFGKRYLILVGMLELRFRPEQTMMASQ